MPDGALSDPGLVHFLRLDEALGSVGEVNNGCHLVVLEDIIDVEVEVSQVIMSEFCCRWTLAQKMRNCLLCQVTQGAEIGVGAVNSVKVFIKGTVTSYEMECRAIVVSVVDQDGVDLLLDGLCIMASDG